MRYEDVRQLSENRDRAAWVVNEIYKGFCLCKLLNLEVYRRRKEIVIRNERLNVKNRDIYMDIFIPTTMEFKMEIYYQK